MTIRKSAQPALRICSLLPSSTEIIGRLGLAHCLVAVTHECDVAPDEETLNRAIEKGVVRRVTSSAIEPSLLTQSAIDDLVRASMTSEISLYGIDVAGFHASDPNLVITQGLCDVCGASTPQVLEACDVVDGGTGSYRPKIVSLEPECVLDVADTFVRVGNAAGAPAAGEALRSSFLTGLHEVSDAVARHRPPEERTAFVLEWLDPPFDAGHWVPELLEIAMGRYDNTTCYNWSEFDASNSKPEYLIVEEASRNEAKCKWSNTKSREITWQYVADAQADVLIVSCCGFDCPRNVRDAHTIFANGSEPGRIASTARVHALDGNRFLARPGPALLEGAAALAMCVWHDCEAVCDALRATGHVPDAAMYAHVDLNTSALTAEKSSTVKRCESSAWEPPQQSEQVANGAAAGLGDIEDVNGRVPHHELHKQAVARGEHMYTDPISGLMVMTEVAHRSRGRCCGSGCRHCPYGHERVPLHLRAARITQPAWLHDGRSHSSEPLEYAPGTHAVVLFWSSGKDSYLALRALQKAASCRSKELQQIVLLTTFDASSRQIAHQETSVKDVVEQAKLLKLPLLGVPLLRGGLPYAETIRGALNIVRSKFSGGLRALAFGDLHLRHIRQWRESADLHDEELGEELWFPIWEHAYDDLLLDLEESGAEAVVSAVTEAARGAVSVGEPFNRALYSRVLAAGVDGFGENGEFHTLVKPQAVS